MKPRPAKRGAVIKPSAPLIAYTNRLFSDILDKITLDTQLGIIRIMQSGGYGVVANASIDDAVHSFIQQKKAQFENEFIQSINEWSFRIGAESKLGVERSLRQASKGLILSTDYLQAELYPTLQAMTTQNVALFKTITSEHWQRVERKVMDSIITGEGLKDLIPFFESYNPGIKNYGKTRALDQTRKAYQSVSIARTRAAGLTHFEWRHSAGGSKPRKLHIELDRKIFEFENPPYIGDMYGERIYGFPAQLPNCRCFYVPIFNFELVQKGLAA